MSPRPLFALIALLALALPSIAGAAPKADPHRATEEGLDGAALYAQYCALCHGDDREGYAADHAPSLRSPELDPRHLAIDPDRYDAKGAGAAEGGDEGGRAHQNSPMLKWKAPKRSERLSRRSRSMP